MSLRERKFGLSDGDDRFSVIFSYAYDDDQRGIDDVEEDYINDPTTVPAGTNAFLASKPFDDLQMRYYKYHRTRQGYGGGFTFQPDDDTSFYLRGVHAGYTELGFKQRLQLNGLADDITSATTPPAILRRIRQVRGSRSPIRRRQSPTTW